MKKVLILLAGASTLAACATPQPDAALTNARAEVNTAASTPEVASNAGSQLQQAQTALGQAEQALQNNDMAGVDHYALLASRYAQTAEQVAQQKQAQQVVANSAVDRERVLRENAQIEAQQAKAQAATAQQQAAADTAAARSKQGIILTPRDVTFQPGKAELDAKASRDLQQVADYLKANPNRRVMIEGFTDSTGSATLNQQLSEERADVVRLALAHNGVDPSRIDIRGMGPTDPIASNDGTTGRLLNRRVSIIVSNADGSFPQPASGSSAPSD
jgi:outer membrane protein OmpA-like peptidoglycan-associated protein